MNKSSYKVSEKPCKVFYFYRNGFFSVFNAKSQSSLTDCLVEKVLHCFFIMTLSDRDSGSVTDYSRSCPGLDSVQEDEEMNRLMKKNIGGRAEKLKKIHKRMNTVLSNYFVLHNE